jgi:hypothetical protein
MERFAKENYLEEAINFGSQSLVYAIQASTTDELTAEFKNNKIILHVPRSVAGEWATTDRVGFDNRNSDLYLLIEKDFKCLDNVEEDQSDNFPNPHAIN